MPFELLDAERSFLEHAYQVDETGRLIYPEQIYSAPKKSGKTGFAALHGLTTVLVLGGAFAEGYCLANDLEQSQGRVFQAMRRIVEARLICATRLRSRLTGSSFRRPVRRSRRSRATMPARPAATRRSPSSMSCGDTPASAAAGCGTRWCRRRRARSRAA